MIELIFPGEPKMDKENEFFIFVVVVMALAIIILTLVSHQRNVENKGLREQAIEYGHAHYAPKTGDWEWIKPETIKE